MSQKSPQIQNAVFTVFNIVSVDRFLYLRELPRATRGISFNFTGVSSIDSKESAYLNLETRG